MHGWAGYSHPQPKKKVSGCGAKIRVGSGLKTESGPICGPIIRAIGCTLCQANQVRESDFMIIQSSLTGKSSSLFAD